ncbi:hypothetical protein TrRE_jg1833 [Triparma retinervis]|uniref:Uncharacterized protein n=1 Tax=Triparma retinervis TaxID=2557542 RepID=A0A9W7DWT8_9STRA|nr:hypothetical protein TrRE_jg1833 [Triparma retinervis]
MVLTEAPRTPTPGSSSLTITNINSMSMNEKLKAWREKVKQDKENRTNNKPVSASKPRPKTPLPKHGMSVPERTTFAYKSANRKLERRKAASNTPSSSASKVSGLAGFSQLKNLSIKANETSTKKKQPKSISASRSLSSSFSKAKSAPPPAPTPSPAAAPVAGTPVTSKLSAISLLRSIKKHSEKKAVAPPPPTPIPPVPPVELVEKETEDVINELNRSVDSVDEDDLPPTSLDSIDSSDSYTTPMKSQEEEVEQKPVEQTEEQQEVEVEVEEEEVEVEEEEEKKEEAEEFIEPSSPYPADDERTPERRSKDYCAVMFHLEVKKQEDKEKAQTILQMEQRMTKEIAILTMRHEAEIEEMRSESAETEQMVTALTTQLKTGLTIAIAKNKALEEELKEAKEAKRQLEEAISKGGL